MNLPGIDPDLYEPIPCPLCGIPEYTIKYLPTASIHDPAATFGASSGIMGTQTIVKCSECGLLYVNPRLKPDFILASYVESSDELYASQAQGREQTFRRNLRIVQTAAPEKGKILDVGAAAGFFLEAARREGWEVHGVEPSKWLTRYGREKLGLNIRQGTLHEADFPDGFFDVVTVWDVLEHVADPLKELREIRRVLKPGGTLLVNFPDIGTWMARLAGRRWWFLLSVHLTYFTSDTLSRMLRKAGFEPIQSRMHFQTLSLGHLITIAGLYNRTVSSLAYGVAGALRLLDLQIPYYASQTNLIAKKK